MHEIDTIHDDAILVLLGAIISAGCAGAVLACDHFTLGAHPDAQLAENGELALVDWSQIGGEVVAVEDAPARLVAERGEVRALGALGGALIERPVAGRWMLGWRSIALEALDLVGLPGGPEDPNLRMGLAMRAVALHRMGRPGDQSTCRFAGDAGLADPDDFERASMIAALQLRADERAELSKARQAGPGATASEMIVEL